MIWRFIGNWQLTIHRRVAAALPTLNSPAGCTRPTNWQFTGGLHPPYRLTSHKDPHDFSKPMRVLLVPSLWRESFGRVAAEGLANGIPVLAGRGMGATYE
jgi:glycosyltransferase involved in cell wall biosynthesis